MSRTIRGMSTIALIAGLALGAGGFSSASQTKSFALSGFNAVSASAGVTVVMSQGPYAVQAAETNGQFDKLVLEVRGSTLVVSRTNSWFDSPGRHYTVTVSAPAYVAVHASSGSSVTAKMRLLPAGAL